MIQAGATILFRADASPASGTGHLRRCLALADALARLGAHCLFVTRDWGLDSAATVKRSGHEPIELPSPSADFAPPPGAVPHAAWAGIGELADAADTIAAVAGREIAVVVVDNYAFGAEWHQTVRAALGATIVAIDDLADRPLAADLIVDHNCHSDHRTKHRAGLAAGASLLGGPRFALLDPVYADAPRYAFREKVDGIGIFLGGVDSAGLSLPVAQALRELGYTGGLAIASTSANPRLPALEEAAATLSLELVVDAPELAEFFAAHDLQIGAAGGATWERCCLGAPTLAVAVAANQFAVLEPLAALGAIAVVDGLPPDPRAIAVEALALAASPEQRRELARQACRLVDGRGAERVALTILAERMAARPATIDDAGWMHQWRNDERIRSVSRQPAAIAFADHLAWLERSLTRRDRRILVAEIGRRPVGVVRFDSDAGRSEVSIYLDPELSGLGLGRRTLAVAERYFLAESNGGIELVAETLAANETSRRLFRNAGYQSAGNRFTKRLDRAPGGSHVPNS